MNLDMESKLSLAATARMAKYYEYGITREQGMSRLGQLLQHCQDELDVNQASNLLLQAKFVVADALVLYNRSGAPVPDLDWKEEIDINLQKRRADERQRMEQRIQALHREHDERDAKTSTSIVSNSQAYSNSNSMDLRDDVDSVNHHDEQQQDDIPPPQPQRVEQLIETDTDASSSLNMPEQDEWEQIPDHLLSEILGQAPIAAVSKPIRAVHSENKSVVRVDSFAAFNPSRGKTISKKRKRSEYDSDDDGSEHDTSGSDNACGVDDFDFQGDEDDRVTLPSSSDSDSDTRPRQRQQRGRPRKDVRASANKTKTISPSQAVGPKTRLEKAKEVKQNPKHVEVKENPKNKEQEHDASHGRKAGSNSVSNPSPRPNASPHSGSDSGSDKRKLRRHSSSVGIQTWRHPNDFTAQDINREQLRHEVCKAQLVGFELRDMEIGTEVQWDELAPAHLELAPGTRQKCSGLVVAFTETHVYVRVPTIVRLTNTGLDHCISKRRSAGTGGVRLVTSTFNRNCVKPFGRIGPYKVDIHCNQPICALIDGPTYEPLADEAAFLDKCVYTDTGLVLKQNKGRFAVTRNTLMTNGTMDIILEKHSKDILLQAVRWDLIPLVQRIISYTENQDKTSATLTVLIEVAIFKPLTVAINTRSVSKEERLWAHGRDYSLPSVLLWMLQHESLFKWKDLRSACLGFDSELRGRVLSNSDTGTSSTSNAVNSTRVASLDSPRPWYMADLLSESICSDSTSARYRLKSRRRLEDFGQRCGVRIQLKDYQVETISRMKEMEQTSRSCMRPFWFPLTMVKSHLRSNKCVFVSPYFQKLYIPEYDGYTTCSLAVGKKDKLTQELLRPLPDMRGGYNAEEQRVGKTIEIISLAFLNKPRQGHLLVRTRSRSTSTNARQQSKNAMQAQHGAANGKDEKKEHLSDSDSDSDSLDSSDSPKSVTSRPSIVGNRNKNKDKPSDDDDDDGDDADEDSDQDGDLEPRMINGKPLIKATLVVVTPKTLVQWNEEIAKVSLSGARYQRQVLQFYGQTTKVRDIDKRIQTADIILTTYKTLHTESPHAKLLLKYAFWRLVLDEVHTVGKTTTNIFEFIKNIARKHYWPLSGTYVDKSIEKDLYGPMSLFNIPGFDRTYFHNVSQIVSAKGGGFQLKQDIGPYVMLPLIMAFRRLFIRHAWLQPYNGRPQLMQQTISAKTESVKNIQGTNIQGQHVASIKERIIRVDFSNHKQRQVYALLLHKVVRCIDAFELGRGSVFEGITNAMKSLEHACSFGNFDLNELKWDELDALNSACKLLINVKSTEEAFGHEDDKCAVCLQKKRRPCQTSCNHVFCQACLELSIEFDGKCPLCRIQLDPKKLKLPKFKKKLGDAVPTISAVGTRPTTISKKASMKPSRKNSKQEQQQKQKKKRRKLNQDIDDDDDDFRTFMPASLLKNPTEASKRVLRSQISNRERAPRQVLKSTFSTSQSETEAEVEVDSGSGSGSDWDSTSNESVSDSDSDSETIDEKRVDGQPMLNDVVAVAMAEEEEEQDRDRDQIQDVCMNPKYEPLLKKLVKLHRKRAKVVIFTKNRLALMNLAREIKRRKMRYMSQMESTTAIQFGRQMDQFNNDKNVCAMLLTYRASSNGINLQKANHVIMFDPTDKAAEDAQALFRVVHTDKAHTVNVYRYIVRHSIEEAALEQLLSAKARLLSSVVPITSMNTEQNKSYDDHASTKKERFIAEMRKRLVTSLAHLDMTDIVA